MSTKLRRSDYSILFGDVQGFSKLTEYQQGRFLQVVLPAIATGLKSQQQDPSFANTWGDGLVAFYSAPSVAIRAALQLRDSFRAHDWQADGLPLLRLRLALHAGEVAVGFDPVRKADGYIGTHINLAARIEPVVLPNHVYATAAFVDRCNASRPSGVKFESIGVVDLAKNFGKEHLYVALREDESMPGDVHNLDSANVQVTQLATLLAASGFGARLQVSSTAKHVISEYCGHAGFWRPDDVVFLESGTLPVYLILNLVRVWKPSMGPKKLLTNNLVAALAGMLGRPERVEASEVLYPLALPGNVVLWEGTVFADYAATIPGPIVRAPQAVSSSQSLHQHWKREGVNHLVMMATKLSAVDGPCAAGPYMKAFKRAMMAYAGRNPDVRVSLLIEAEKLVGRSGEPVGKESWTALKASGRVAVVAALSPQMSAADTGLVHREVRMMRGDGVSVVLLDASGAILRDESAL
ncbi:MAG TPA: adenylate/guanylate cyclase domain-containing protein [Thermoanaerobaculia bacterium]